MIKRLIEKLKTLRLYFVIKRLLHIHNYKITDLMYEQPIYDYDNMYCDYRIEKCKCGKTKRIYSSLYYGEYKYRPISNNLQALILVNKRNVL